LARCGGHYAWSQGSNPNLNPNPNPNPNQVRRPLLVVASDDDPIVPIASLPLLSMEANPHIVTAVTTHGWP
jgi:predicted alpha/beta-fold hydrolase